jgi:WD40 repeat protein
LPPARDGRIALSGGDDAQLRMWELKSGRCLKTVAAADKVFGLAVNADLSRAVFACSSGGSFVGTDQTRLLAWDLERDRPLGELKGHVGAAKCVALSADGRLAASGGDDHSVRIWDVAQGGGCRRVLSGHQHYVSAVCLSADGELAVSGSWDTTVRVWDTRSGRCLRVMQGHDGIVNALALSADARLLISGGWDRTVRVWDVATGRCLRTFAGHEGIVSCVALGADATLAASGSWDKTVRLWRLPPPADDHFTPRLSRRITYAQLPSGEPEPDEAPRPCRGGVARAAPGGRAGHRGGRTQQGRRRRRAARCQLWALLAQHCRATGIRDLSLRTRRIPAHRLGCAYPTRGPSVVAAQRGRRARLWDLERNRAEWTLDGHRRPLLSIVLSDDERSPCRPVPIARCGCGMSAPRPACTCSPDTRAWWLPRARHRRTARAVGQL